MRLNSLVTTRALPAAGAMLLLALAGCSSGPTAPAPSLVPLTLKAQGSGSATVRLAAPLAGAPLAPADETPVEVTFSKALLVVRDVRFVLPDDASYQDTTNTGGDQDTTDMDGGPSLLEFGSMDSDTIPDDDEDGGQIRFHGPFVIDLLAHTAQELDTQMVPAGDYKRVQGHLQALHAGDAAATPELASLVGSTVWLEGTIGGEGGGPFSFLARIDTEFQIRGKFTVEAESPATGFITFDVSKWLMGRDGRFLDPRMEENANAIKIAIKHSVKVGMDDDHDGEMDDDLHGVDD